MGNRLNSTVCAAAFIFAASGFAFAADMAVKAPPRAIAPPAPAYMWTGCYIGGNLGGAWDHISTERTAFGGGFPDMEGYGEDSGSSFVGGGQIGCDYQLNQWVFGIQAQEDWGKINTSHVIPPFPSYSYNSSVKGFATVTGRVGVTVLTQALLYVKGGGAWTRDDLTVTIPPSFLSEFAPGNVNFTGWTFGGGLEWLLLPYLSFFVEIDHMDFGSKSVLFIAGPHAVGAGLPADTISHNQSMDTVLVGLNLRCCQFH